MKAKMAQPVVVDTPEFRSEAEEAAWWDKHQDLIADLLLKHGRRGPSQECFPPVARHRHRAGPQAG